VNAVVANAVAVNYRSTWIVGHYLNPYAVSIDLIFTDSACIPNLDGYVVVEKGRIGDDTIRISFNTRRVSFEIAVVYVDVGTFCKAKSIVEELTILNVSRRSDDVVLVPNESTIRDIDVVGPCE
jgi:hypothetical protein